MENLKRLFKNLRQLWQALLMLCCVSFVLACSKDDDGEKAKPVPLYDYTLFSFEELFTTSTEDGLAVTRDESGRVTSIESFQPGEDITEKLKSAPASFEDISHFFPLSEGNELRLSEEGELDPYEPQPYWPQSFQSFQQYYKNVPVSNGQARMFYYLTPEGKRMSNGWFGPFVDVNSLDPKPSITEQQACQVLADYLDTKIGNDWTCTLTVREYSMKKEGKIVREVRLIYTVIGPVTATKPNTEYCFVPRCYADVDAHTGQLLTISFPENM